VIEGSFVEKQLTDPSNLKSSSKVMLDHPQNFRNCMPIEERPRVMLHLKGILFNLLIYCHNHIITHIPSHVIRRSFLRRFMWLDMGEGCATLLGLKLYTRGQVSIGAHSVIDRDCTLDGRGVITIGQNVNLAPEVMILTAAHDPDSDDFAGIMKAVVIEDYVWVATRAIILPGVRIGCGAVVGAGSVVTKDVAAGTIVAGNPAKVIRIRKCEPKYQLNYDRLFH
jgi:acetyltransferase-like isoleucine patch superfamily enzyme